MRLLIISDTHGLHNLVPKLPEADVFIHAGDFANSGKARYEYTSFNDWLDTVPVPKDKRLIVAGNHDLWLDEYHISSSSEKAKETRELLTNGVYLQDEEVVIDGVKFYFSPWTPYFMGWGFNVNRGPEIAQFWKKIPDDVEVLVTHGPPYGMLDKVKIADNYPNLGCEKLAERIKSLPKLKVHIFGHIHGSRGQVTHCDNGVTYINASFLNEAYRPYLGAGYTMVEI